MRTLRSLYNQQFSTICIELRRLNYISKSEWHYLCVFEAKVPQVVCDTYRLAIQPIIALMRLFPILHPVVHTAARFIWVDYAIKRGKQLCDQL